jgi:hypothetical protein
MSPASILTDQATRDAHGRLVGEDPGPRDSHCRIDTQEVNAVPGPDQLNGQPNNDTHVSFAVEPLTPQPTTVLANPIDRSSVGAQDSGDHRRVDTHSSSVAAPTPPAPAKSPSDPSVRAPVLADPLLALAADVLDDLERVRIANENRLRQLTRDETDKDGQERGFGLTTDHPDVARLAALVEALAKAEHDATLNLQRMVRRHPLGPWIKQAKGVGEKQAARLLAAIGDPYWNDLHNRPRLVSELWAFCGYSVHKLPVGHVTPDTQRLRAGGAPTPAHQSRCDTHVRIVGGNPHPANQESYDTHVCLVGGALAGSNPDHLRVDSHMTYVGVAVTRQRGMKANWSPTAKMRAFLIAESIVKAGGPYREVYDHAREKYADAIHAVECKRCGPAGKPAPTGSPISAGHQHARALRLVAKTVLKDLWREAKRIHEETT